MLHNFPPPLLSRSKIWNVNDQLPSSNLEAIFSELCKNPHCKNCSAVSLGWKAYRTEILPKPLCWGPQGKLSCASKRMSF